jgi:hypothetical protein
MNLRLKRLLKLTAACFVLTTGIAIGQARHCSQEEAIRAEMATDQLKTWQSVYRFYKQYSHCDDGSIGEGISDAVAKLLANRWDHFSDFVKLASDDKEFGRFVVRHVDETIDWSHDAPKINENARQHCPSNSAVLCKALIKQTAPERR